MNKHLYADLVKNACETYASRNCLHLKRDGRYVTWTYADFHRDLNRLTSVLARHGLGKGKNAAVIGENSPEWVIAFHGILLTGACTVPIDPNLPPSEIEEIISATRSEVVFCSPVYLQLFQSLKRKYSFITTIILLDETGYDDTPAFRDFISAGDERHDAFGNNFDPIDPMVIIFTSGTTGKAKGAVLMQKNYSAVPNYAIERMQLCPDDVVLSVLPLHHVLGFSASIVGPLCGGMSMVFVPQLKGPLILEALRDKGVTMMPLVPKMIGLFYDNIQLNVRKKGFIVRTLFALLRMLSSSLGPIFGRSFRAALFGTVHRNFGGKVRVIISGGAALGERYWKGFQLMGFNILEGYGLTETFGPLTVCPFNDPRFRSVGPALPENEVKIASPGGDGIGEVLLHGTCVFAGYYKREDFTRECFDKEGWFITGDLGRLDKDGFLFLSGRKKDVIVLESGKNVYPDEVEDHFSFSPQIEEIGVFGHRQKERIIVAAVIVPSKAIRAASTVSQATQVIQKEIDRMNKDLPSYRSVTDFVVTFQPLPRTTTRKIRKTELGALFEAAKRAAPVPVRTDDLSVIETIMMESPEFKKILDVLTSAAKRIDRTSITPRTCFKIDLGLDSLDKLAIASGLEETFSVSFTDEQFEKTETIAELIGLIRETASRK